MLRTVLLSKTGSLGIRAPEALIPHLEDFDLAVDLGHRIGSLRWWRGLLTLSGLITSTLWLATPPYSSFNGQASSRFEQPDATALAPAVIGPLKDGAKTGERVPMSPLAKPLKERPEPPRLDLELHLKSGESLSSLLRRAGASADDTHAALTALGSYARIGNVPGSNSAIITFGRRPNPKSARPLEGVAFRSSFDLRIEAARLGSQFLVRPVPIKVIDAPARIEGQVGRSLFVSARELGAPAKMLSEYIKALSFSVDFEREVSSNDRFSFVFERKVAETGDIKTGRLLYAKLERSGGRKDVELVWFAPRGENPQFFEPNGASVRRLLMKTPIDGARMTSGFGFRLHPILGYSRLHKGVDFAAGAGTPVMSAGTGTVVFMGYHGGHGNYVKVRHANGFETAYAHLQGFRSGLRAGSRIDQGQVLGYVGSTGLSTAPHLHYEIYLNGKAVNPTDAKLPTGRWLKGQDLSRFLAQVSNLRALPRNQAADDALASAGVEKNTKVVKSWHS